jgi:1H-pyrrole-2-carbonyl-[peptidyl-carrier protein] brominase
VTEDVVIVGGGPGGSVCALQLLRQGLRPVIIEAETFPRFSVGESLTGECGARLRGLGLEDTMRTLGCPVKHGVEVWGTGGRNAFYVAVQCREPEGLRPTTTWQVLRSEFDRALLDTAVARGARLVRARARDVMRSKGRVSGIVAETPDGARLDIAARFTADASGQTTFLANRGVTGPKREGSYGRQVAFFAHLLGAVRDPGVRAGDTGIFYRSRHEWAWFIPVGPEATSVGVVVPLERFRAEGATPETFFAREILQLNPALRARVEGATRTTAVHTITNYSYIVGDFAGPGFICIGDAHRFTDPIFSFGVHMTMTEAALAADAIAAGLDESEEAARERFASLTGVVEEAQDVVSAVVDVFWDFPLAFQRMAHRSHREGITDIFAGRFHRPPEEAVDTIGTLRRLQTKGRGYQRP